MPDLKLAKLPDRTPVKLSLSITPDLNAALEKYAQIYNQAYGQEEKVTDLVPFMLQSFLDSDKSFAKALKDAPESDAPRQRGGRRKAATTAQSSATAN